jgi:UrcA family protein
MQSRRVLPAFALTLATGLLPAAQASAQATAQGITVHASHPPGTEIKDEEIKVADLNLNSDAGVETMIGRIRGAASRICMPRPTAKGNFKDVSDYERCRTEAVEDAIRGTGNARAMEIIKRTGD